MEACTFKTLVDGKELAKAIGIKPGPWMKDALDVVMAWQLRNPGSTDSQQAIEEVKHHQIKGELSSDLIQHFLKLTIRPLFTKASPAMVTEQGRQITTERLPEKFTMTAMDDSTTRPWKSAKDAYSLDILRWMVHSLDEKTVAGNWPLIIPPLLTLIDDWEAKYKALGASFTTALLNATPPELLERTGLGEVFEQALIPCLTYLPTITDEAESMLLLSAVYPALLILFRKRFPAQCIASIAMQAPLTPQERLRMKCLDSIIRKGIIYGYSHCGTSYPAITAVLFHHLAIYLDELSFDSVKHLKYLMPMLSEALSNPTGSATVPMLLSATNALQAVIRNAWPRMENYRGEALKGLCMCWIKIMELEEGVDELKNKLKETVKMPGLALGKEIAYETERKVLVEADPRLSGLLLS